MHTIVSNISAPARTRFIPESYVKLIQDRVYDPVPALLRNAQNDPNLTVNSGGA